MAVTDYAVVVPTLGRPSLRALLESLARAHGPAPRQVLLVDDRPGGGPLPPAPAGLADVVSVVRGVARGPAAARNAGWRTVDPAVPWVVFLDDDVTVTREWRRQLAGDLDQPADVGGVAARITVPLPADRRPTDWERSTGGLADAAWITADMAYRRGLLEQVGGFDQRFPRAYREDADLALRVQRTGARLVRGCRKTVHPVRPADRWVSVRVQAGNADDPLMRRLHGPDWRAAAQVPRGRRRSHVAVTAAMLAAVGSALAGRPRLAAAAGGLWLAGTARFAWLRIKPGPRSRDEVSTMLLTSAVIPPVATWHWLRGAWRHRRAAPWPPLAAQVPPPDSQMTTFTWSTGASAGVHALGSTGSPGEVAADVTGEAADGTGEAVVDSAAPAVRADGTPPVRAVLFDRDGTLVHDIPYNGDPDLVRPIDGAVEAVAELRARGIRVGVVTNQSGVGRGRLTDEQVRRVNSRLDQLFGRFDVWQVCPHSPDDGCACRKPAPAMVLKAAAELGVAPQDVVVIGDIGADMAAAEAAGARGILVPTEVTRPEEVAAAPTVAVDIREAVRLAMGSTAGVPR